MRQPNLCDDRGAGLVEYALVVMLIAIGSLATIGYVGDQTGEGFEEAATAISADGVEEELTPEEKWDKALADYDKAIADAKATKAAAVAEATATYKAALAANNALPKADRSAANQEAKAVSDSARAAANETQKGSEQAAKDARAAAKAEYNATK